MDFDALNATQKKPQLSANYRFCKKLRKKQAKMVSFGHFDHFRPFWLVFLDFLRNHILQRGEVFCIAFSASKTFFWAIKINNLTIFQIFHQKGGLFTVCGNPFINVVKNLKEKTFRNEHNKTNTKWVVEVCWPNLCLIGSPLPSTVHHCSS